MRTIVLFVIYVILVILLIPVLLFCYLFKSAPPIFAIGKWAVRIGQRILGLKLLVFGFQQAYLLGGMLLFL